MKTLIICLLGGLVAPLALAQTNLEKSQAYYQKGLEAEKAGDPDTALAAFKAALQLNPNHAKARFRAGEVKINKESIKANATKLKIGGIIIPKFDVEDASISETLELLSIVIEKESNGEVVPNFFIEDPKQKLADRTVTLTLKNIPVSALMKLIHGQTNTRARYDEHAVVIRPL